MRKCSSIAWKPASSCSNPSGPIASIVESPIAESIEYRPPTQSQKPNAFAGSMPNAATPSRLVETATKWRAIAASSPPSPSSSHRRAVAAFVIVSSVVNVFEQTTNSVSAGIEVAGRLDEVRAVDVRDEAERQVAAAVVAERAIGHHGPEIRAADADVDDVADRLPR